MSKRAEHPSPPFDPDPDGYARLRDELQDAWPDFVRLLFDCYQLGPWVMFADDYPQDVNVAAMPAAVKRLDKALAALSGLREALLDSHPTPYRQVPAMIDRPDTGDLVWTLPRSAYPRKDPAEKAWQDSEAFSATLADLDGAL